MSQPTTADAELMLHLYELRTEETMRKARNYVVFEFWPKTAEEYAAVSGAYGSQQNAYLRQVITYWEMAASFLLRGAVNEEVFTDNCGELFFIYAKFSHVIEGVRKNNPLFFKRFEDVVNRSPEYKERIERIKQNIAKMTAAAGK